MKRRANQNTNSQLGNTNITMTLLNTFYNIKLKLKGIYIKNLNIELSYTQTRSQCII